MASLERVQINSPDVIHDIIDGEAVIVNLNSGNYYSLERVGAEVWNFIALGKKISEIVTAIGHRYELEITEVDQAIKSLIDHLLKESLVVPCNEIKQIQLEVRQVETIQSSGEFKFEAPILQKYTDMQDLLLLDPIHETDDTGWPNIKVQNND